MEISLKRCATAAAHVAKEWPCEWPPSDAPPQPRVPPFDG